MKIAFASENIEKISPPAGYFFVQHSTFRLVPRGKMGKIGNNGIFWTYRKSCNTFRTIKNQISEMADYLPRTQNPCDERNLPSQGNPWDGRTPHQVDLIPPPNRGWGGGLGHPMCAPDRESDVILPVWNDFNFSLSETWDRPTRNIFSSSFGISKFMKSNKISLS